MKTQMKQNNFTFNIILCFDTNSLSVNFPFTKQFAPFNKKYCLTRYLLEINFDHYHRRQASQMSDKDTISHGIIK